jgi:hypothetical protein
MLRLRFRIGLSVALIVAIASLTAVAGTSRFAGAAQRPPETGSLAIAGQEGSDLAGRYIVVLDEGTDAGQRAALYGAAFPDASVDRVYESAIDGFAGALPETAVAALEHDPNVTTVQPDGLLALTGEVVPIGIERVGAAPAGSPDATGPDTDIDVAIIDTGVGPNPDLNVAGGFSSFSEGSWVAVTCGHGGSWNDWLGHGSEVAGIIGARDDDNGVVGIAPGARIWSVRVVGTPGLACTSDVIAGIDWVTQHADVIDVVNISLGGGNDPTMCAAIARSVAAGVTYVVAAGNSARDAEASSPANCPDAITVSALTDFDGLPGGLAARSVTYRTCRTTQDDSLACFSNFGSVVDLTAPGVEVVSTDMDGLSPPVSGTSFSSPHVAGVAARFLTRYPGTSPAVVRAALIASGECHDGEPVGDDEYCDSTWPGDIDGYNEPLVRVDASSWVSAPGIGPTRTPTLTPQATATPTATGTPAPDRDSDDLADLVEPLYGTDPDDPDTDGDGCKDGAEASSDPRRGGLRDPLNPWDFYDVNGDGRIDVANDLLQVISRYRVAVGSPRYEARFDRGRPVGPYAWSRGAPDGRIDVVNDILPLILQYNHRCG